VEVGCRAHAPHPCTSMVGCVRGCCGVTVTTLRGDGHSFFVDTDAGRGASLFFRAIDELADGSEMLPAPAGSSDDDAASALCDRGRVIHKVPEVVVVNFFLNCGEQSGFLHGVLPELGERDGGWHTHPERLMLILSR
jgi:hypothetical protein